MSEENKIDNEESQEGLIEIPETVVEENDGSETEGMSDIEIARAKELGLISDVKAESSEDEKVEKEEDEDEVNDDPDNFEEMDEVITKDEKKFHKKFSANQKALYFKMKSSQKKVKEKDAYAKELEAKLSELSDAGDSKSKLDKIAKLLKDKPEDLTIEELQAIISKEAEKNKAEDDGPITQQKAQEKQATKVEFVRNIGNAKYNNFEDLAKLADEVVQGDTSGIYLSKLAHAFENDDIEESEIVESIVKLAKLNDKYSDTVNKESGGKPEKKESRIIKNSKKKISSASVGGAKRGNLISEDDITVEQAVSLLEKDPKKYHALKKSTKERLLREMS